MLESKEQLNLNLSHLALMVLKSIKNFESKRLNGVPSKLIQNELVMNGNQLRFALNELKLNLLIFEICPNVYSFYKEI